MIFSAPPDDFKSKMHVVVCYIECAGRFLMLLRQDGKREGNTWGTPGGKRAEDESSIVALLREIGEETGIRLRSEQIEPRGILYVRHPYADFVYERFSCELVAQPEVVLASDEHKAFCWVTPQEALALPLVMDEETSIRLRFDLQP